MKEKLPIIAGALLGVAFIIFGLNHFLKFIPMPAPPEAAIKFFVGIGPSWMGLIKILEIAGGILVAIPKTRNFGLLVLGPIVINILACNVFLMGGIGALLAPPVVLITALSAYLLWVERAKFLSLLK